MTDMRDLAVALATKKKLRLFKLEPGTKRSAVQMFYDLASADPERVYRSWTCPASGDAMPYNIGVSTGYGLLVLDVDVKGGKPGLETLRKLVKDGLLDLEGRYIVRTPSGGLHIYGTVPVDLIISGAVEKWPGVDVRAHHNLVVGVGSEVGGKEYVVEQDGSPFVPFSDALVRELPRGMVRDASSTAPIGEMDTEQAIARARDYLTTEAPEAILHSGMNNQVYKIACRVRDYGISEHMCAELMADHWNETKAFPPLPAGELEKIIENAYMYAKKAPGNNSAEFEFSEVQIDDQKTSARGVSLHDFRAYAVTHSYIYTPVGDLWPASSVNSRIPLIKLVGSDGKPVKNKRGEEVMQSAAAWLDVNRSVEQMTWAPGLPTLIRDKLVSDGGWTAKDGATCFNLYRPPTIKHGNKSAAGPWIDHVKKVFPDDAEHLIRWFAHRVQRPGEKINHAIVLGGAQGIGKDTLIEPVKRAVGPWNVAEVSPQQMLGRFNGFLKSVVLRLSEARDLGDVNRFQFYDHMKAYTASPPDTLRVDEKHRPEYSIFNCVGIILTTNHKADGIFLPADDRRHYVAWSQLTRDDFTASYWKALWDWYESGGDRNVAAYLAGLDLDGFNPKAPPPKTPAFWDIVGANQAPEEAELRDLLDRLEWPEAVTLDTITDAAKAATSDGVDFCSFVDWLRDRKNRRFVPHRLAECGYVPVRNPDADSGLWRTGGKRQVVYARNGLSLTAMIVAARNL